jgi:hypothetical protein
LILSAASAAALAFASTSPLAPAALPTLHAFPTASTPRTSLTVRLDPDHARASTTIHFAFHITPAEGDLPPALTKLVVRLPPHVGIDTSGLAVCRSARALEAHGARACSPYAQVGSGVVDVRMPLGEEVRLERATLTVFNGASHSLLFLAVGRVPIATRQVFPAVIQQSHGAARIDATIPIIRSLPNSPDGAIVSMSSSIGTLSRRYYRSTGGHRVLIHPRGVTLPSACPPAGLPFAASFVFAEGPPARASSVAACRGEHAFWAGKTRACDRRAGCGDAPLVGGKPVSHG